MDIQIFQRFQIKDQRGNIKNCQVCKQEFGVFTREHQCKRCLRSICAECGETKKDVYKANMARKPHRICDICKPQSSFQAEYIGVNKLVFGKDSDIALKWHQKLPDFQEPGLGVSNGKKQGRKFTIQIFNELWNSYNYSLREMMGLMTYSMNQNEVYEMIVKVYEELLIAGVDQKIQNLIYVIVLMLCFSSPQTAIDLIKYLYDLKKSITEGKQLLTLYLKALKFGQEQIRKLTDYLNYKLKQFVSSFSVNVVPAKASIHLFNRIFDKKKIDEVYMFFALLINHTKEILLQNKNNKSLNDLMLIRQCDLNKIIENYRLLANVKSSNFIRSNSSIVKPDNKLKLTQMREEETQSETSQKKKELMVVGNFKKKKNQLQEEDGLSIKTISMNESKILQQKTRRASKQKTSSKVKFEAGDIGINMECQKCREKDLRMKELEQLIKKKNKEIDRLKLESEVGEDLSIEKEVSEKDENILKVQLLQGQLMKKIEENDDLFRQLTKQQKENNKLKSQIQQIEVSNKMLKNKVESSSLMFSGSVRNSQKEDEALKMNQIMKKTLIQKNKQIQQLMKKNKLLSYQVEESHEKIQRAQTTTNVVQVDQTEKQKNQQLMDKLEEMSQILIKQQQQKMDLSNKLFQYRERVNSMPVIIPEQNKLPQKPQKNDGNCIIF